MHSLESVFPLFIKRLFGKTSVCAFCLCKLAFCNHNTFSYLTNSLQRTDHRLTKPAPDGFRHHSHDKPFISVDPSKCFSHKRWETSKYADKILAGYAHDGLCFDGPLKVFLWSKPPFTFPGVWPWNFSQITVRSFVLVSIPIMISHVWYLFLFFFQAVMHYYQISMLIYTTKKLKHLPWR